MQCNIISWNVNGFRSIIKKGLGESILPHSPHILCLQEIKYDDISAMSAELENLGYHNLEVLPAVKKGYSGTLTAWDSQISISKNDEVISEIQEEFFSEGRLIDSIFSGVRLLNLYLPSGSSSEERQIKKFEFMDQFYNYLSSLPLTERSNMIICGDLNICHTANDIHHPNEATKRALSGFLPEEREWFTKLLSLGYYDAYRIFEPDAKAYSWWSYRAGARKKNLGWRLDYFLCGENVKKKVLSCNLLTDIHGSDHCPLKLSLTM